MPTCAACLQPITHGQGCKLVDTEVFHTPCVHLAIDSITRKQAAKIRELQLELDIARHHEARANTLSIDNRQIQRKLEEIRDENRRLTSEVTYLTSCVTYLTSCEKAQRQDAIFQKTRADQANAQLRDLSAQITALTEQRNTMQRQLEQVGIRPADPAVETESLDDAALRFRLMDLDLSE